MGSNPFITLVLYCSDLSGMILSAFGSLPAVFRRGARPVGAVFLRQVYFTGLEAFRMVLATALLIGTVVVTQMASIVGAQGESLTAKVMVWVVVRELAPLLTGIIVLTRSGTAIAVELAHMKINREIEYLEALGIPSANYLVLPRIFGVAVAVVVLTVYFEIAALCGGFLVASLWWHVAGDQYAQGIFSVLTFSELVLPLSKSLLFGLFLAAICCRKGLSVGKSVTQIPQAATKAVMQSLLMLLAIDGVASFFFLI